MKTILHPTGLLARLVSFDSTSRNSNLPIADFICEYLDRPGIEIKRCPSPDGQKANLLITVGESVADRGGLILSGHMDVVPADEPDWETDPFVLTEKGGRLYGRGACDMKGFVALAIDAAVAATRERLRHPLVLLLTYDEEVGLAGAKHFAQTWTNVDGLPRAAIIGEPTRLRVVRMHKGYLEFSVEIKGLSAHSGYPHLGESAIEPAGRLITGLTEFQDTLRGERAPSSEHFPEVPFAVLNIGRVAGGSATNVVPDYCKIECCFRNLPGTRSEDSLRRVESVVADVLGDTQYDFRLLTDGPPMLLREDAAVYQALCSELGQDETVSASYATDAGWLQQTGMECAVWGPGSIEVAHKPNESITIEDLQRAEAVLATMIQRFCAGGDM